MLFSKEDRGIGDHRSTSPTQLNRVNNNHVRFFSGVLGALGKHWMTTLIIDAGFFHHRRL